jgi:methylase of polypeptide subunit release factors
MLIASSSGHTSPDILNTAALVAYHAAIEWGMVLSPQGATLFNSHWIRDDQWFRLPLIEWKDLDRHASLLESTTPEGVTSGRIDGLATNVLKPDRFLSRVDDVLVDRLDHWRNESLKYSRQSVKVDEQLQLLFAQFFVLRAVEDRGLRKDLPTLETALQIDGAADLAALNAIFAAAREHIQPDLFSTGPLEVIPEFVIGGVIRDLYFPHGLPAGGYRYNFAWIDADVLGRAYEKYLSHVLTPAPLEGQLRMFDQPLREVERISVRKTAGVYYTPDYLSGFLTEQCLERVFPPSHPDEEGLVDLSLELQVDTALLAAEEEGRLPRIADFACGSGSFLVAATNYLIRRLRERDPNRNWARELVDGKNIVGIDIDERAVTLTRMALWNRFTEEPNALPLPRLEEIVVVGDSLTDAPWKTLPETYDVVLGNPPFIATGKAAQREELAARFKSAQGRFDYSYLFVELAVQHLLPGGFLGMVVPNRLFRNRDAGTVREILTSETDIVAIVDFGPNEVFPGITAYIGSIVAQKHSDKIERCDTSRVVVVSDISPRYMGALLARATLEEGELHNDSIAAFDVPQPRGDTPWLLLSPKDRRLRHRLDQEASTLGAVAGIFQGIRTGANDIFILTIESTDGDLARVSNGLGDTGIVETALLHPTVFGSDIQRYEVVVATKHLLYPYRSGTAIAETELREAYPRTFEYLNGYREPLSARGSIAAGGLRWYELVRKRDEKWLTSRKLLTRDLATETSFAIDNVGSVFLVGGTAVVPGDPEMALPLLAYLNSSLVSEFLSQITPTFKSGFQKFEPQHLQRVPILSALMDSAALRDELTGLASIAISARMEKRLKEQQKAEKDIERLLQDALKTAPAETE